jgi:hypothetical protein
MTWRPDWQVLAVWIIALLICAITWVAFLKWALTR